ncbi:hypothetical protein BE08_07885 [Sorangium cellulosum]|uniref:Transglutaminase-like domain-containing protein n=1 Tax=Sorangium cellulosum TaxID=56 RepID=A0A150P4K4_SORCE|nr:hypothetical protein BE08_07885 [Sorangium cellulosum]
MPVTTRKLRVVHTTRYTYDRPVERSAHELHLRPMGDGDQRVLSHTLTLDPAVPTAELEDAFGNRITRFEITSPYTALTISADSTVELLDADPFAFANAQIRPAFPLVWTPWEQAMIAPYVRPVELPAAQRQALFDHAMSFVARNDADLMETLFAINLTLFREYQYVPGSTDLSTTPHDVFVNRRGVCQDFANLFICLARLLGVPARYVCGYVYTGNVGTNRAGSDATHAWAQLYIPGIGWKGFDPTNGVLTGRDHVRVGYGHSTLDVTPTAGTLYTTAAETMTVAVTVSEVT